MVTNGSEHGIELDEIVKRHLGDNYQFERVEHVPHRGALALGSTAFQVEATVLSVDIRQYSGMTNMLGQEIVTRMLRAFFNGSVRLVARANGQVADFNGDGMIILFTGNDRTERAVRAAAEIRWFLSNVLRPMFARYFTDDRAVLVRVEGFDVGCGIDDGLVLISRVGSDDFSDIAWVGRSVNTAAKLCKDAKSPNAIVATHTVFERLEGSGLSPHSILKPAGSSVVGGVTWTIFASCFELDPTASDSPSCEGQ
jgi:class 3 adenylate cyclase